MSVPYRDHAPAYWQNGWQGVLPLPANKKANPPEGYTGHNGAWPSRADVQTWTDHRPDLSNIALRLPPNIIGLDVDAYDGKPGAATVAALEARLGALPATVISTSRDDGQSGIRLYRVPHRPTWHDPGNSVEIIHYGWRYIVAPPSVHPSGRIYRWIHQDTGESLAEVPNPDLIPELPTAWVEAFSSDRQPADKSAATDSEVVEWLSSLPKGAPDKTVADALKLFHDTLTSGGSRHQAALEPVGALVRAGEQGSPGVPDALGEARTAFVAAVTVPGEGQRTEREAIAEWRRSVAGAYRIVKNDPTPNTTLLRLSDAESAFIDWPAFWARDRREPEWVYPDVLARGRGHALYASHKAGKSLLMLHIAARLATSFDPYVVCYFDYEMTEDDLHERLEEMGYGPDIDLSRLRYALLPSLPPLDTQAGSRGLTGLLDAVQSDWPDHHLVAIFDTTARAVSGEENSADTFRAFYAHTGIELKRRGVTWARLDHAGKDPTRGQRGSSGKGDDVDVVWKLQKTMEGVTLRRDVSRMSWVPEKVAFKIIEDDVLTFTVIPGDWPEGTKEVAELLDKLDVPLDASVRQARKMIKEAGEKVANEPFRAALKWRRDPVDNPVDNHSGTPSGTLSGFTSGTLARHTSENGSTEPPAHPTAHFGTPSAGETAHRAPPLGAQCRPEPAESDPDDPVERIRQQTLDMSKRHREQTGDDDA